MRYIVLALLFVSCGAKKQMLREYVDEVINERINIENQVISNTTLNDNITISYRVNEYDTLGRVIKETIADVKKEKKEETRDSIIQKEETINEVDREGQTEIKEKRNRSSFWIGLCSGLLFLIAIYFIIKIRK